MANRIVVGMFTGLFSTAGILPLSRTSNPVLGGLGLSQELGARRPAVDEYSGRGGADNSPSFTWLVKSDVWGERLSNSYSRRPHPVFPRVPGYKLCSIAGPYFLEI